MTATSPTNTQTSVTTRSAFVDAVTRRGVYFGWVVVASCFIAQMITAVLIQGLSTYLVPLQREFGWSNALLGLGRSFQQVEGLLGPFNGTLLDRFGPRLMMLLGVVVFAGGLLWLATVESIWAYYLACGLMAVGNSLMGMLVVSVAVNSWFRRKASTALGIALIGMPLSAILFVPLLAWAEPEYGWRVTAVWSALGVLLIGLPGALIIRDRPERFGLIRDGLIPDSVAERHRARSSERQDFTYRQALTSRAFWGLTTASGLAFMAQSAAMTYQFAHMELSASREIAALVLVCMNVFNIVGRALGGYLGDHFEKRKVLAIDVLGTGLAISLLGLSTSTAAFVIYGAVFGLAWGIRAPLMGTLHADYFGRASFGRIMGTAQTCSLPLALIGPVLAGYLADQTGGYQLSFLALSGVSLLSAALYFAARRPLAPPAI